MTSEQTEADKRGGRKRQPSRPKAPKKTPEEKALEATAKAERQRQAKAEKARAAAAEKERKAERQRQAKAEKERAAAAEKERLSVRARDGVAFIEALKKARSEENQLVDLKEVVKNVPASLRPAFAAYWREAIDKAALPAGVSSLMVKAGKSSARKVFLLSDLNPSVRPASVADSEPGESAAAGADSARVKQRLLSEFDRLNEANGKRFYVTLFDLRGALPEVGRHDFDAALNDLRRDWVLTLSAAEGLHETVPAQVLDAGITEQSRRLVYVARRET